MYFIALEFTARLDTRSTETPSSFSILSANVTNSRPIDGSTSTSISTSLSSCWSPLAYDPNNAILLTLNCFCSSGLSLANVFRISSFVITVLHSATYHGQDGRGITGWKPVIRFNALFAPHYKSSPASLST